MYDESELSAIGPIVAAFVDPDLTTVVGEWSTVSWATALPNRPDENPVSEPPDVVVRAPRLDDPEVPIGAAMSGVDERPEREELTWNAIVALMRHPIPGPMKAGGGGRSRTKPMKISIATEVAGKGIGGRVPGEIKIVGLSGGELDLYERHPELAAQVLVAHVGACVLHAASSHWLRPEPDSCAVCRGQAIPDGSRPMLHAFYVYVSEYEAKILKAIPGTARRALIDYAATMATRAGAPRRLVEEYEAARAQERRDRMARAPLLAEHDERTALLAS